MLSIGISFHDFKVYGSNITGKDTSSSREKEYTLDLLFGDIFYSRAVIYLLRYQDYKIFNKILNSLKKLHEGRLKLHRIIKNVIEEKNNPSLINSDISILLDANRLLFVSFEIGDSFLKKRGQSNPIDEYTEITEKIILYKTYNELLEHMHALSAEPFIDRILDHLASKINFTGSELSDIISKSDSGIFKSSTNTLLESLDS